MGLLSKAKKAVKSAWHTVGDWGDDIIQGAEDAIDWGDAVLGGGEAEKEIVVQGGKKPVAPVPDDESARRARERRYQRRYARAGRAGTVLSEGNRLG